VKKEKVHTFFNFFTVFTKVNHTVLSFVTREQLQLLWSW